MSSHPKQARSVIILSRRPGQTVFAGLRIIGIGVQALPYEAPRIIAQGVFIPDSEEHAVKVLRAHLARRQGNNRR